MKKILLCLFMALFILSSLCLCAFATDETTSVEYADWFGSSSQVVDCYSYTVTVATNGNPTFYLPFGSSNACTAARDFTVGSYSITSGDTFYADSVNGYSDLFVNGSYVGRISGTAINTVLYIEESSFTAYNGTVRECTPVYLTEDSEGFITSGFLSSLGIVGDVLGFILGSPLLALVGLSVGVFLIGWGITSVKDLIKGY